MGCGDAETVRQAADRIDALRAERDALIHDVKLVFDQYRDEKARAEKAEAEVADYRQEVNAHAISANYHMDRAERARDALLEAIEVFQQDAEAITEEGKAMLTRWRAALAPVEAKPCEYLDPPVCIDPSVCVSKCRFHGTVAEPHHALKGGDDGR